MPAGSSRLIIVSNRLPITVREEGSKLEYLPSSGGLATGLRSIRGDVAAWVGWPGSVSKANQRVVSEGLPLTHGCIPVLLPDRLAERYYDGYSNRTLWPLLHSFQSVAKFAAVEWEAYVEANEKFLHALAGVIQPGDKVWVHDYQLMLLPALLRERYPELSIGFFLHVPFPPFDVFRLLPQHRVLMESLLAADLIGFHTRDYEQSFLNGVHRTFGIEDRLGSLLVGERAVQTTVHPMGVDFEQFSASSESLEGHADDHDLKRVFAGTNVVFSVSRLDYTKGILQSLASFELLLERGPEHVRKTTFLLVVVPSREKVDRYASLKREIDEAVGRINARFGSIDWTPIRYLYRHLSFEELVLLYKNSEVALVTPLRDGLNLIAKEYVAARNDERGVLILSEMAGAAKELLEALIVNPNSKEEVTEAMSRALAMSEAEQRSRMAALRDRLIASPVHEWGREFVGKLDAAVEERVLLSRDPLSGEKVREIVASAASARRRLFVLDYDGTLMPFTDRPSETAPDERLLELLGKLARDPKNEVVILSGRGRKDLDRFVGGKGVSLVAEHGGWVKWAEGKDWVRCLRIRDMTWKVAVQDVIKSLASKVPGSSVEEKEFSLVWHYRRSDRESADAAAKDLVFHLLSVVGDHPVRIVPGSRSIEVRCAEIGKGAFIREELDLSEPDFVLIAGDDVTDEDMFRAAPQSCVTIKVGRGVTAATTRVRDPLELRRLLTEIAATPSLEAIATDKMGS